MSTATKAARPRPAHNGAGHNGAGHNGAEHNGAAHNAAAATDAALAWMVTETVVAALTETCTVAGEIIAHTTVAVESAAGTVRKLSGWIRNSVGGSGSGGGVVEVEPAGGVQGVLGGAGEVAGGQDRVSVAVFAGQVDREAPAGG